MGSISTPFPFSRIKRSLIAGIYLHIPFCKQACSYCDFYFITRQHYRSDYIEALLQQIDSYADTVWAHQPIETLYIGGGTPSLLALEDLGRIQHRLQSVFRMEPVEWTFELNPDDVTEPYLSGLKELGVTRPSMGIQSFQPELLRFMHRAHSREEALKSLELLAGAGFPSWSTDLIYGNPGQSIEMLSADLDIFGQFQPPHLSAYSLTIEPNTRLGKQHQLGRLQPLGDDHVATHFDLVNQRLAEMGIVRYEVSNYAQEGQRAVHNFNYWSHKNYLGLGPGAHSFLWEEGADQAARWSTAPDIKAYIAREGVDEKEERHEWEQLDLEALGEERIMLGLRTTVGVSLAELNGRYGYVLDHRQLEKVATYRKAGLMGPEQEWLRLTDAGVKVADSVTAGILAPVGS